MKRYIKAGTLPDGWGAQLSIAESPDTSPEVLAHLAKTAYAAAIKNSFSAIDVCKALAYNANTPLSSLELLATLPIYFKVQRAVATNPNASIDLINSICSAGDDQVCSTLSKYAHASTDPSILDKLSDCIYYVVRLVVAQNRFTESNTLKTLCADPNEDVRIAAANNPNLSPVAIRRLAVLDDVTLRDALMNNRNIPDDVLQHFTTDPDFKISRRASNILQKRAALGEYY